jgi:hypothetical protein
MLLSGTFGQWCATTGYLRATEAMIVDAQQLLAMRANVQQLLQCYDFSKGLIALRMCPAHKTAV